MILKNEQFTHMEDLSAFIDSLLMGYEDIRKENIYFDRLFTYSYLCLDKDEWNEEKDLPDFFNEFFKFQYVLPGGYNSIMDLDFMRAKNNIYSRWKYSIYGFCRESGVVMASESETFNVKKLPRYFETIYFYMFLLAFYQRISLILFSEELMSSGKENIENLKKSFTQFTHFSWFSQITNSEQGMDMWKKWQQAFDLPELFDEVQKEYSEFYEYIVARGQEKINALLIVIYTISVLFQGISLMFNFNLIDANNNLMKIIFEVTMGISVAGYPIYVICKRAIKFIRKVKN